MWVLFLISGAIVETLAWANNFLKAAAVPALFHPQLVWNLVLGIGFYSGWAAWLIVLRWFRFTLTESFVVTGLQGIFFEQLGAVFQVMVHQLTSNPLASLYFGLYVFVVHGAGVGLPMAPVISRFDSPEKSRNMIRFPLVCVLMVGLAFAGCAIVAGVASLLGGLPPPSSRLSSTRIGERPAVGAQNPNSRCLRRKS
ncbi:MAG: hypothetical protein ACT4QC_04600 [Planctomycetaceae bacterium]